jgi:hypothetical protein
VTIKIDNCTVPDHTGLPLTLVAAAFDVSDQAPNQEEHGYGLLSTCVTTVQCVTRRHNRQPGLVLILSLLQVLIADPGRGYDDLECYYLAKDSPRRTRPIGQGSGTAATGRR